MSASYQQWLNHEISHYEQLRNRLRELPAPEERVSLEIHHCRGFVQYYAVTMDRENGVRKRLYLKKAEESRARDIQQRRYHAKALKIVEKNLKKLKAFQEFEPRALDDLYLNMPPERQALVAPLEPTPQQRLDRWRRLPRALKGFSPNDPSIYTNNGERVRSKSEKILADLFERLHMVYIYENPVYLGDVLIHPDFTFYNPYTDEEVYWEHMGKIDDANYADHALRRLELYQQYGIYLGTNLIVTMESSRHVLNQNYVMSLIQTRLSFAISEVETKGLPGASTGTVRSRESQR